MESIKEMVDVNTIVGDAVQTIDGTVIIPVSKVTFGFAAGGGEFATERRTEGSNYPFAGGSGAGVGINPVAFLIVGRNNNIRMIPAHPHATLDRALESIPNVIEKIKHAFEHKCDKDHDEEKDKDILKGAAEKETLKYQDPEEDK